MKIEEIKMRGLQEHADLFLKEVRKKAWIEMNDTFSFVPLSPLSQPLQEIEAALCFLHSASQKQRIPFQNIPEKEIELLIAECHRIEAQENALSAEKSEIEKIQKKLEPLRQLKIKIEKTYETEKTKSIFGKIRKDQKKKLFEACALFSHTLDIRILEETKNNFFVCLTFLKPQEKQIKNILEPFAFLPLTFEEPILTLFSGKKIEFVLKEIRKKQEIQKKEWQTLEEQKKKLEKKADLLKILHDQVIFDKENENIREEKMDKTEKTFSLSAWIQSKNKNLFALWIQEMFHGEVYFEVLSEPGEFYLFFSFFKFLKNTWKRKGRPFRAFSFSGKYTF